MRAADTERITVVIPVCDDPLIFRCLASIDLPCRVIVSANGSPPWFLDALRRYAQATPRIAVLSRAGKGIGGAYNHAIDHVSTPWIVLMDSDCVFEPGAISRLMARSADADVVKGRVCFESNNAVSRLVASARRLTEDPVLTHKVSAYSPPLLYRIEVVGQMGGYHFDSRLAWREDRDFELRRRRAGIPVCAAPDAVIWHKPLSLRDDLRSVWAYGTGQAMGERLGVLPRLSFAHELRKACKVLALGLRHGAVGAALYGTVRGAVLCIGRAATLQKEHKA
ncbi:glycosyltransferase family 2 protein [Antribacter gilvus]|uniref:glycosyltransferase family 2 protein n=1 Tax=Antribacter gilvus TaxID=2304675 RepID=UPI000F7B11AE|nr:glycosyltransferase family 2 protein [Antribacter gilvus]